jgi:teichuronic acid biosynthesis glycosyltransferase TuaG
MARVDIIIPTYNPDQYICETIESIINQTFSDWRILLINDGSDLEYEHIINQVYSLDDRIELINLSRNTGGGNARNVGLKNISAFYVAFCDSDDRWPKEKLERQLGFMDNNIHVNMTHCDMLRFDNGSIREVKVPNIIDINIFLSGTQLYCSSVVLKKSIIENAKFGTMSARHPFKFWCSILSKSEISYRVENTYFEYLVRQGSVSSNKLKMLFYTITAYLLYAPSLRQALSGMFNRIK